MRSFLVLASLVLSGVAQAQDAVRPVALAVKLGRPFAAESPWGCGERAGALSLDLTVRRSLAVLVTAGLDDGASEHEIHGWGADQLRFTYLAVGVRLSSTGEAGVEPYLVVAAGVVNSRLRSTWYDWQSGTTTVEKDASTGLAGLGAFGLLVALPGGRWSLVAEVSALVPAGDIPGPYQGRLPATGQITAGARYAF